MADLFQALASPVRRDIIRRLKVRDMTAGEIASELSVSKPTLSGHFNVLKAADLVIASRSGTTITYSLNTSVLEDTVASFMDLIGHGNDEHEEAAQ